MRYLMIIKYDGSKFHGFQRQNNVRNVQGYLEKEISKDLNEDIEIKGSGRTDAKVHAYYQGIHFDTDKNISNIKKDLNKVLKDLKIKKVKKVSNSFHARHSVKNKTYLYKIDLTGNTDNNYYLNYKYKLNIKKMKEASKYLIGYHDYRNFVAGDRINYKSTINNIKIYKFNNVLYIKLNGIGFYRYMVRNIVGALLEVGKGKIDKEVVKGMIDNYLQEKRLPTSSPNGLYLYKIKY